MHRREGDHRAYFSGETFDADLAAVLEALGLERVLLEGLAGAGGPAVGSGTWQLYAPGD